MANEFVVRHGLTVKDGFEGTNKVLVSDASGKAKWESLSEFIIESGTSQGQLLYWHQSGDPPIWVASPTESLCYDDSTKTLTISNILLNSNGFSESFSTYNPVGGAGNNIFIGGGGFNSSAGGTNYGSFNTSLGHESLRDNTSGRNNTAVGYNALQLNTSGYQNIAVGFDALQLNTAGYNNSAMGIYALYGNIEGHSNVAIGFNALFQNTIGYQNVGIGRGALYNNYGGNNNIGIGYQAGYNFGTDSGSNNIAIGYQTGRNFSGSSLNNIFIGNGAGYQTNQKLNLTGSLALGTNSYTTNNYQFVYGGSEVQTHSFQAGTVGIKTLNPDQNYSLYINGPTFVNAGRSFSAFCVNDSAENWNPILVDTDNNYIILSDSLLSGSVGIGTQAPTYKLEVHGNTWFEVPNTSNKSFVVGSGLTEDEYYYIRVNMIDNNVSLYNLMYITPTQVCIGGSSAATNARLDVEGTNGIAGIYLNDASPTNNTYKLYNKEGTLYWNGAPITGSSGGGGTVSGNGSIGFIPKYITTSSVGNSIIYQSGSSNRIGINVTSNLVGALQIGSSPSTSTEGLWFGTDTNLYRYASKGLKTDSQLWISGSSDPQLLISANPGNQAFSIYSATATVPTFYITTDGHMCFGEGEDGSVVDCTIYRYAPYGIGTYDGNSWQVGGGPGYILPASTGSTAAQCILWKDENNSKTLQWVRYPKGAANRLMYFDGTNNYWSTSSNMSWDESTIRITGSIDILGTVETSIRNSGTPSLTNPILQLLSTAASSTTAGGYLFVGNDDGAAMESGSRLGSINFVGAENTNHSLKAGASINGIVANNWSGTNYSTNLRFDVYNGTDVVQALLLYYDGTSRFYGNVTARNFILSSDKNLKTNIKAIPYGSLDIHYKQFEFKSNPNDIRYGVIAQDIIDKYPELVLGEEGNYSVKYIDLLIREIANLKERIKRLENKVYGSS